MACGVAPTARTLVSSVARSRSTKDRSRSQVALSFVLLAGAGLFLRVLDRSRAIDAGFFDKKVLSLSVDLSVLPRSYDEDKGLRLYRAALQRAETVPGVQAATWGGSVPLAPGTLVAWFVPSNDATEGATKWIQTQADIVGPHYMRTLGIPTVRGRDFQWTDDEKAPGVAIVNQTLADRHWPGENPVGRHIKVRGRAREDFEIIGVVQDTKYRFWVVRQGATPVAAGVVIGAALSLAWERVLGELLFGIGGADPLVFGATGMALAGINAAVSYRVGRRAAWRDPMTVLRQE